MTSLPSLMNASVNLITHPEIEYRPLVFSPQRVDGKGPHKTLVDVLEIFSERVVWREHLDQAGLLNHFKVCPQIPDPDGFRSPFSRIKKGRTKTTWMSIVDCE